MSYITNPSGGGATTNKAQVTVDFGFQTGQEGDVAIATVSASWVTSGTILTCTPCPIATTDHDPDDYAIEGIQAYARNIVPGVSFDVVASAATGSTFGKYVINIVGT